MNSRTQLLIVLKYIMENGSERDPVSYTDIFEYLKHIGGSVCKVTMIDTIRTIKEAGFDLISVKKGRKKSFYIPSECFDTTEGRLLADAVVSANFVTPSRTRELLRKILKMTDKDMEDSYMKDIIKTNRHKHTNNYTYYSINVIQEALCVGHQICFHYFDLDENGNRVYRHNGKVYEVCPITLINGMNNYYLIAYDPNHKEQNEKTFRIDRMSETRLSKRMVCKIPFNVDDCINRYQTSIFSMFSGRKIMAEFEFDFHTMNIIYDKYGEDIHIIKIGANRYYAKLPIEDSPTFWGWIFMLEDNIRIISPDFLILEYKKRIDHMRHHLGY